MQERYFLINNYLPVMTNLSKNELKINLIRASNFTIFALIEITESQYYYYLERMQKSQLRAKQ